MEDCEMCGKQMTDVFIIAVDPAQLRVCKKCAKGAKVIGRDSTMPISSRPAPQQSRGNAEEDMELIENYGAAIRNAREAMKLPLKVLAEMLNEKETLLLRVEEEKTKPPIQLTKKLERALNIRLAAPSKPEDSYHGKRGDKATLGDFIVKR